MCARSSSFALGLRKSKTSLPQGIARAKHERILSDEFGKLERLTIEYRTSKEHQKLDEQILLVGGDFVPAEALSSGLDIAIADALLDVGFEPLLWHYAFVFTGGLRGIA